MAAPEPTSEPTPRSDAEPSPQPPQPPEPPPPVRLTWGRAALLAFAVFHGLTAIGSTLSGSAVGDAIRTVTRPYERAVGVYQDWPMFAPNAPTGTFWLEVVARDDAFEEVDRWPLYSGEVVRSEVLWGYDRLHKLERTLGKSNRKPGREALLERECQRVRADPARAHIKLLDLEERGRKRGGPAQPGTWTDKEPELVGRERCRL